MFAIRRSDENEVKRHFLPACSTWRVPALTRFPALAVSYTFTYFVIARGITLVLLFRYSVKNRNCLVREHRSLNLPFNNQSTSIQLQRYGKLFWLIKSVKWLWHEYLKLRQQRVFPDYRWFMFSILFFATKAWCSADRFFTNCSVSLQAWSS